MKHKIQYLVTDADLKLNQKMAVCVGHILCKMFSWNPRLYRASRHSFRSGSWRFWRMYKLVK